MQQTKHLLTIKEASIWASDFLKREINESNISYLVQYGKVKKHSGSSSVFVDVYDLQKYYESYNGNREFDWKKKLGDDLNWALSFDNLREKDTTKHVHRLHPYKGKFIPQLVQYFIDEHTDNFKKMSISKKAISFLIHFRDQEPCLSKPMKWGSIPLAWIFLNLIA